MNKRCIVVPCAAALVLVLAGCSSARSGASGLAADAGGGAEAGGGDDAGSVGDAGSTDGGDDAGAYPAPHPPAPQIRDGGTVMRTPTIATVSFAGDPLEADIDAFATAIGATTYWGDRVKEYGIAVPAVGPRIHDPTTWPATLDDAQIQSWLVDRLGGASDAGADAAGAGPGGPGWSGTDGNTLYALYFPPGVTITNDAQQLPPSCGTAAQPSWHGYHSNVVLPGDRMVPYAVISRCDGIPEDPTATGIDYVSAVASHEVIEGITDPFITSNVFGYVYQDQPDQAWTLVTSAELGDMCALVGNAFYTPPDFPYRVQRIWSNAVAATGHDPCLPEPAGQVYFNAAAVVSDDVYVEGMPMKGVQIPVGQSKTIEVDLFSEAPTPGPWSLRAVEADGSDSLSLSLDETSGQNGDKVHLTITVKSANPSFGGEAVAILSTLGTQRTFWPVAVGN